MSKHIDYYNTLEPYEKATDEKEGSWTSPLLWPDNPRSTFSIVNILQRKKPSSTLGNVGRPTDEITSVVPPKTVLKANHVNREAPSKVNKTTSLWTKACSFFNSLKTERNRSKSYKPSAENLNTSPEDMSKKEEKDLKTAQAYRYIHGGRFR